MTPKQRFQAALSQELSDRIPVFYQHLGASSHFQKQFDFTVRDAYSDPDRFARMSLAPLKAFGLDNAMAGWGDLLTEAQAHGLRWKFTDPRFYPRPDAYLPMERADEVRPTDPMRDAVWSVQLRAAKMMVDRVGREVAVVGSCVSPTLIASETIGMENMMMAYYTQPDLVHAMLRSMTESCKAYGERAHQVGIEEVFVDDSTAGREMVPPDIFDSFDGAYLSQVMAHWRKLGLSVIIHNDSAEPYFESQLLLEPEGLHIHLKAVEPSVLFEKSRGKACVLAGIDHTTLLFTKTPEEVEAEVTRVIGIWGEAPGLIMAPGCELPYKTPLENIVCLREATQRHGGKRP